MDDENPESIPIRDLRSEDGAHELATSENMQPYLRLLKAGLRKQGHGFAHRRNRRSAA